MVVKGLLWECLTLVPRVFTKRRGAAAHTAILVLEGKGLLGLVDPSSQIFSEKPCLKNKHTHKTPCRLGWSQSSAITRAAAALPGDGSCFQHPHWAASQTLQLQLLII